MLQTSISARTPAGNYRGCVHPGTWTDETRVERLKMLWADGLSASEIATLLGEVTRNAVIGKVHRLGLAGRKTTTRQPRQRQTSPSRTVQRRPMFPPRPPVRAALPVLRALPALEAAPAECVTIVTAGPHNCLWPIGDPKLPDFHLCGRRKSSGVPYCEHHAAIAYNPAGRSGRSA
jgi:GcrA cell cycle regulator